MPRHSVLPDTPTRTEASSRERPDATIFLGDYFDQFHDAPQENRGTAQWLKQSLAQPNRIHLWGNHDTHYAFPGEHTICGGYTHPKDKAINEIITTEEWRRLRLYHLAEGFLFTHAGLHRHFVPANRPLADFLAQTEREALSCLARKVFHWSYTAGYIRGGWQIRRGLHGATSMSSSRCWGESALRSHPGLSRAPAERTVTTCASTPHCRAGYPTLRARRTACDVRQPEAV